MDINQHSEPTIAVFADFENLALGAEQSNKGRFQMELVMKRLLERGLCRRPDGRNHRWSIRFCTDRPSSMSASSLASSPL